jgi:hypothetical protein
MCPGRKTRRLAPQERHPGGSARRLFAVAIEA